MLPVTRHSTQWHDSPRCFPRGFQMRWSTSSSGNHRQVLQTHYSSLDILHMNLSISNVFFHFLAVSSSKRNWLSVEADGRIIKPKLSVEPYDCHEASLVFRKERFWGFPLNDKRDFETIHVNSELAYFDHTHYISELESFSRDVLVFLRPRRFSKSLFLSTLAHFHGVEYKQNYKALFQVHEDVKSVLFLISFSLWLTLPIFLIESWCEPRCGEWKRLSRPVPNSGFWFFQSELLSQLENSRG